MPYKLPNKPHRVRRKSFTFLPKVESSTRQGVEELATNENLLLICGRYEGVDERIIQSEVDEEWSIGDFVMTGGEIPAMTLDRFSVSGLCLGVLGDFASAEEDSFANGLLDCPHYTRPEVLDG